jgi:alpha-methylacyl-CoA racemase
MSVAAIEPLFYTRFLQVMGLSNEPSFANQMDASQWPSRIQILTELFLKSTRDEWQTRFADVDCCVVPVNLLSEVAAHPQMKARANFVTLNGVTTPAPTPRFSGTPSSTPTAPHKVGSDTDAVFKEFGL